VHIALTALRLTAAAARAAHQAHEDETVTHRSKRQCLQPVIIEPPTSVEDLLSVLSENSLENHWLHSIGSGRNESSISRPFLRRSVQDSQKRAVIIQRNGLEAIIDLQHQCHWLRETEDVLFARNAAVTSEPAPPPAAAAAATVKRTKKSTQAKSASTSKTRGGKKKGKSSKKKR
jgi:hypothetical protein